MAHTVMCVCTVYFTAIVGCAFSSPRLTSGESQQDDTTEKDRNIEREVIVNEEITLSEINSTEEDSPVKSIDTNNLDDTGGGGELIENATFYGNATSDSESALNISSETYDKNQTEKIMVTPLNKTKMQELIKHRHTEGVKAQILTKLRLKYPPKLRGVMPKLPMEELGKMYFELSNDEQYRKHSHFYAKTVRKFIMGADVTTNCLTKKSAGCYNFDLRGRVDAAEVQSVHLWIYKLFNHNDPYMTTFIISELGEDRIRKSRTKYVDGKFKASQKRQKHGLRIKNIVERFDTTQKYGWLKVDITNTAMRWLQRPMLNKGIAVICKDCQRKNYKTIYSTKKDSQPFLVVATRRPHRRQKRSYQNECTETSTECCLMPFTINFREIGWDAVAYPHSVQINYCTGSCHAQYAATTNHTNLIQSFRWTQATHTQMQELTPCCSPISYRAQSILYFDGDKLQEARIPNLAVTACGCN